jgi:hypothetical protein
MMFYVDFLQQVTQAQMMTSHSQAQNIQQQQGMIVQNPLVTPQGVMQTPNPGLPPQNVQQQKPPQPQMREPKVVWQGQEHFIFYFKNCK